MHIKGYAATETKRRGAAVADRGSRGCSASPLKIRCCYSPSLYGFWGANYVAFNGDVMRDLAAQFLTSPRSKAPIPLMIGHRVMGNSLLLTGEHR